MPLLMVLTVSMFQGWGIHQEETYDSCGDHFGNGQCLLWRYAFQVTISSSASSSMSSEILLRYSSKYTPEPRRRPDHPQLLDFGSDFLTDRNASCHSGTVSKCESHAPY